MFNEKNYIKGGHEYINAPVVLMVEDDAADLTLIAMRVRATWSNAEVIIVDCISDAYEIYKNRTIDLFLLDLNLPDAYGANTVQSIRAFAPHTPIIVVTGTDLRHVVDKAKMGGACEVISKNVIMYDMFSDVLNQSVRFSA